MNTILRRMVKRLERSEYPLFQIRILCLGLGKKIKKPRVADLPYRVPSAPIDNRHSSIFTRIQSEDALRDGTFR